ncbi:MAG: TIGR02300 family protein [Rhodospirillales bacterium]|nr:TIGR02300 family protein [Rhodospirillales bacterium]
MATKADRGTKRTCQDASCAVRFYDLAREPITCPTCGTVYQIAVSHPVAERRPARRFHVAPTTAGQDASLYEARDNAAVEAPGDDTLPEEDEDDTDPAEFAAEPVKEDR